LGDGAAAMIITSCQAPTSSRILGSCFETHIEGANLCVLTGGGTKLAQAKLQHFDKKHYQFHMQGKQVFKMARRLLPKMLDKFFKEKGIDKKEIDWVVPHQASGLALAHVKKALGFCSTKFLDEISHLGNQMSASIPLVFHLNVQKNKIKRGDRVLMLGTGAGLSMGLILLEY
jgi:3-oxoacyl-[acyl-carrier-protein] synthase-3